MRLVIGLAALCTAALVVVWVYVAAVGGTPCGLEGSGILNGSPDCPVQAGNVSSLVVGAMGTVATALAAFIGAAYALTGQRWWLRAFQRAWIAVVALALLLVLLASVLPSTAANE